MANALLCYLKFFKYLARIKQLRTLIRSLALAGEELFYFLVIFFVIFIGFSMSYYLAFAGDVCMPPTASVPLPQRRNHTG